MAEWGTTDSWLTSHCHGGSRKGVEVRLWKARVRTAFWGAGMGKRAVGPARSLLHSVLHGTLLGPWTPDGLLGSVSSGYRPFHGSYLMAPSRVPQGCLFLRGMGPSSAGAHLILSVLLPSARAP